MQKLSFVEYMYNSMYLYNSTDEVGYILLAKVSKPKELCPTQAALILPTKRAHFQTIVWRKAVCRIPELPDPTDLGWRQEDDNLRPVLMSLERITPKTPLPKTPLVQKMTPDQNTLSVFL